MGTSNSIPGRVYCRKRYATGNEKHMAKGDTEIENFGQLEERENSFTASLSAGNQHMHGVKDSVNVWQMFFRCPQDTDGNKQGHLAVPVGQFLDLVPREQATRPLSEGGLGIVDIPDKVRSIGMRAIELLRATAASYDRLEIKLERVCRAKVRS